MLQLRRNRTRGISLIELLVAVGLLAVLVAMLLPAVQKVRQAALRADTSNRARQIVLAIHHAGDASDGVLASVSPNPPRQFFSQFTTLLPYIEQSNGFRNEFTDVLVTFYQSRTDPSYSAYPGRKGNVSFASNAVLFRVGQRLANVSDGTSNTIAVTERYARCGATVDVTWTLASSQCFDASMRQVPCANYDYRRATFADTAYDDVTPTDAARAGSATFQVAPSAAACDPTVPQSPQPGGIICVTADGSTRVIRPEIPAATFWALVTPDAGDVPLDW